MKRPILVLSTVLCLAAVARTVRAQDAGVDAGSEAPDAGEPGPADASPDVEPATEPGDGGVPAEAPADTHPESHPPRALHEPALAPIEAAPEGAEALLELVVDVDGALESVSLVEARPASAAARVGEAARAYVRRVRFEPAMIEGTAVRARVRYRVRFPPVPVPEEVTEDPPAATDEAARAEPDEGGTDEGEDDEAEAPDEVVEGGELGVEAQVDADLDRAERTAVSDLEIELGELRRVPRDNAQNLLSLAPGLLLSQFQNEGHAASMFLRGFDAEEGEDLEILLEGIPLNEVSNAHGHGYADTLVIVPQLVESVRVVQGPFDPAQGDFAIAGTAEYRLGLRERGLHGQVAYGTYGQRRLGLWWGPEGQEDGTLAGIVYNGGDGWGLNRAFSNVSAMGQFEGRADDRRLRYRLLLFGAAAGWDSPGLLREDDFERRQLPCEEDDFSQFYCTYDTRQGGSSSRLGGSAELTWLDGPDRIQILGFGMGRSLRVQENFTGFSGDPRTDGGPQRGDLTDQRYDAATFGLRASYRRRFLAFDLRQQLEVGLYARQDFADTVLDRIRSPVVGPAVPYATDFDRELAITNVAAYLRFDLRFTEWLELMAGVRADGFNFRVVDRNFPEEDVFGERLSRDASDAFGFLVQPRGAVKVRLVDGLRWVTSAGLGARSSDAAALSEGELAPFAEVIAAETGLALELGDEDAQRAGRGAHLTAGLAGFYTRVSQDLVFDAANGRNSVTGPSHRTGATANGRLRLDGWLDTQLSVTYTRAHLPPPETSPFDLFAGPRLPYIPEWLVRFDGAASHTVHIEGEPFRGSVALGALFLSPRPLPLGELSEPWFVLDAAVSVRWRWIELGVSAQNLLDLRYRNAEFNYVSNWGDPEAPPSMMAARHFAAAPPLRVLASLTFHVQFDAPDPWASEDDEAPTDASREESE
ncbi:MAG TPA: TonB-dependent receptor [Sandaracinaceae bacterium LLY-WYZ-13_1]|nr:TonB-dependent receptor [Sandaracinaceae bacterium LLY-WYZ-13_1]